MATKFKTQVGTYPNRSGIQQIPAGASHIPQSYLNSIGRNIDSVRINSQHTVGTTVTPGGVQFEELNKDTLYSFPFKVTFVGLGEGGLSALVTIQEGRVHGRIDSSIASYADPLAEVPYEVPSLGVNSVENIASDSPDFPPPKERPDENTGGENPSDPSNNNSGGGSTNYNNPWNPRNPSNPGTSTSNNKGVNSGGVYHTVRPSGNAGNLNSYNLQNHLSGNAGNINGNTSGIYHTQINSGNSGNLNSYTFQNRVSGNAGSITGNTGSTYHTNSPSGNAGDLNPHANPNL